jgi:hypothetical protein
MSALLQAPPVWYLVQHSQLVLLNMGTPCGTLPLGKIASHFSSTFIWAQGKSWLLTASFFRSFGLSSLSDFCYFFFCCCFSSGSLLDDVAVWVDLAEGESKVECRPVYFGAVLCVEG